MTASVHALGTAARSASRSQATASTERKNEALEHAAQALEGGVDDLLSANEVDLAEAKKLGITGALLDRLILNQTRIEGMANGLRQVASQPDPVGQITAKFTRPNGLEMTRFRVPLGVVAVIYEARPNVTSDAAGLALKAGNAVILRGSSYALQSNLAIGEILRQAQSAVGLDPDAVQVMEDVTHEGARALMQAKEYVDLLVPRGGQKLLAAIESDATVPYVIDGAGNCHIYVDEQADLEMARAIVVNAKVSRPGVCNSAEKLLLHEAVAEEFLPMIATDLEQAGVEVRGDDRARSLRPDLGTADSEDWATEYLDLVMAVKVVDSIDHAIDHIRQFGTGHTEAIITANSETSERFVKEVDSAVVMVNASTRFTDGEEFGYGAEIGISTQKIHVRGPMGLEALTSERWTVRGEGQIR